MSSTGKKEYTLKINGVDRSIKDVTTLEGAVLSLDTAIGKVSDLNVEYARTTKATTAALTEEEKAAKKLEDTQKRMKDAQEGATDAQVKANQELREAVREQTRKIQIEQLAEGSVKRLGMELTDLRNAYQALSRDERESAEVGGAMLTKIQALDAEYKQLKESTGQYQDSVGNYGKALDGLGKVSEGVDGITKSTMGMAQGLLGAMSLMALFGSQTEEDAKAARQLQKIIALLSIAQQVNNNLLKEGIIQNKLSVITDTIRTAQIKAKTAAEVASTKGTVAATVAQKIFNAVAYANPYVLLAMALVAVGAALFAFASNTENAAEKQKKLNDLQSNYLDTLEDEANKAKDASNERVAALERQLKVLEAQGAKQEELRKVEGLIAAERRKNNNDQRSRYAQELKDLDENREMLDKYRKSLRKIEELRDEGNKKIVWEVDFDGNVEEYDVQEALDIAQSKIDFYGRKVQIAVGLNTESLDLDAGDKILAAKSAAEAKERAATAEKENKDRAKAAAEAAKKRADTELSVVRTAEDARTKLIQDGYERDRQTVNLSYDRQIEDLRKRLATEKDLTEKACAGINDTIASLEKQKASELEALDKERLQRALELQQEVEDSRISLIVGGADRQAAEINAEYDRQIADYQKRLEADKTLTEEQQKQITELILNAQTQRGVALAQLTREQMGEQADLQLTLTEDTLAKLENKIGEIVVRSKTGLQLIDVEATRKNLADTNQALDGYISGLAVYLMELKKSHMATLATLQEGTPEYTAELLRYERAVEDTNKKIGNAQKEQAENTKKSSKVQVESLQDLFGKMSDYASAAASAITMVTDTLNMGLQAQLDDLNTQLDALNERYEEAQKQRENAAKNVEDIEEQMRAATGGTAEALKAQLMDAQQARDEAAREERRIAKEKERAEAEIARKEKQMKRNDLIAKIAQGVANTALGVTQALGSSPPPLNFIMAGIVGALGLAQTGIMTKQLVKLADGGEIIGPSHANGGVPIAGTNYEVEGGEFVVNKHSYSANAGLVKFINDTPRAVTAADIIGVLPSDSAPVIANDNARQSEDRIVEAIKGIKLRPVVSVRDINAATDDVVTVEDLAGF